MPKNPPTAIDLLLDQHREVEELFAELEVAGDAGECEELGSLICDKLAIHAKIEEKLFYPNVKAEETEEILLESVEEHLEAKRCITDLLQIPVGDARYKATAKVLKDLVQHHVEEEESELFPKVRRLFDEDRLIAIGQEMMAMVVELEGTDPRLEVLKETNAPAPL
jgi:hemerythrin superfamily protein